MKKTVIAIGACVADTLCRVPHYPKEDTKLRAESSRQAGGGPAATGLVAAAKLGFPTAFAGVLSDDAGGQFLMSDFKKYGVSSELIRVCPGHRSFCSTVLLSAENASRTCGFDKGDLPALVLDGAQKRAVSEAAMLLVDGNELSAAVEAARLARDHGVRVLYDCGGLYDGVEKLLALTDYMIPSEEFALGHTGTATAKEAAHALFSRYAPQLVVITQGKRGGLAFDGKELWEYPAMPARVVDSNGAGDTFHGAFAAALLQGYSYRDCCLYASAVSALKCTGIGARESIPDHETTIHFLKENGYEL